ncbi:hypothetical protein L6267_03595 [Candidatus Parcubacteria bacterium]|nr:hypothetical protein [Candidatus Parcubacteria bacterium]
MKKKLFVFAVFVAALFIASPTLAETFMTVGDVCINADQYQEHQFERLDYNHTTMSGNSPQTIIGCGLGDPITFVEGEAELLQYEPYSKTEILTLGQVEYNGNSQMHIWSMGGTDETFHTLDINTQNDRSFCMENIMDESMMNSTANACASFDSSITAAPGAIGSAGLNDQLHSYTLERNDGAWQQGLVRTRIISGEFPQ